MNMHAPALDIATRLKGALSDASVPSDLLNTGRKLLSHLEKPTQITVLGPRGSGKSTLVNMIIGAYEIPQLQDVSSVKLVFGDKPKATFTGATSGPICREGLACPNDVPQGTTLVVQELPLAALDGKSVVEVALPDETSSREKILEWVTQNSDITIWCSQYFDQTEAADWSALPDSIKDRGIFALTKADQLHQQGTLDTQRLRFAQEFADDFLAFYPVATLQARAAQSQGQDLNVPLFAASGGKALLEAIENEIATGKSADLDYADMLLAQITALAVDAPVSPVKPPVEVQPVLAKPVVPLPSTMPKETLLTAQGLIDKCVEAIAKASHHDISNIASVVLDQAGQTIQALLAMLKDVGPNTATFEAFRADIQESEQIIVLNQLEATDSAASDTLMLLLQLKKELSEVIMSC